MMPINHTVSTPTPPPWWELPAGFVPAAPFHPQLKIVTEGKILERVVGYLKNGDQAGAHALVLAMGRALNAPNRVDPASVKIEVIPGSDQPPTVQLTGEA